MRDKSVSASSTVSVFSGTKVCITRRSTANQGTGSGVFFCSALPDKKRVARPLWNRVGVMSSLTSVARSESQQPSHGRLLASYTCTVPLSTTHSSYPVTTVFLECGLQEPEVRCSLKASNPNSTSAHIYLVRLAGGSQVTFTAEVMTDSAVLKVESAVPADGLIYTLSSKLAIPHGGQIILVSRPDPIKVKVKISMYEKVPRCRAESYLDLSSDLAKLLKEGVLSDVVLQVQSGDRADGGVVREFRAHKAVLSARSPVFQCLFTTDMAECRTATVPVNFSVEVTERILWYAYTGQMEHEASEQRAPSITENMDVLAAADFYDMQPLKSYCEELLMKQIASKPEEVLRTIVLADKYGAVRLKRVALDLAASDPKQIQQHPEWLQFLQDHRSLVNELFASLAERVTATPR